MGKFFLFIAGIILIMGLASASFTVSNTSIESKYAPGAAIRGWVNISLEEENADSLLTGFEDQIGILDFLVNNSLVLGDDFSCSPSDCNKSYTGESKQTSKSFSLNAGSKKVIGIKISGLVKGIGGFSMELQSDAGESDYPQVFIDLLDDNKIDWQANNFSGKFGEEIYNCYDADEDLKTAEITQTEYCQKIRIPPFPRLKIGADVAEIQGKGGNVNFQMRIYNGDENEICIAEASGSGKISCEVDNLVNNAFTDFFVCVRTEDYDDNNKYTINYEEEDTCGFSGDSEEDGGFDFAVFVNPGKYSKLGTFIFNQDELDNYEGVDLAEYIGDYVEFKYRNNCTNGCIIPISIISGVNQNLVLSNFGLTYDMGVSTTEKNVYDLSESPAKISMDFQVLDLEKSEIKVPESYGNKTLKLQLDGQGIVSKLIEVVKMGAIEQITPLTAAAAVPTKFMVYASGNISKYKWEFSDGENVTTTENYTSHTFSKIGKHLLKVTITTPEGSSSKTVEITVVSPYGEINKTLAEKERELLNLTSSLRVISGWYKEELEEKINIDGMRSELQNITERSKNATEEEYVGIVEDLYKLQIPSKIDQSSFRGVFLPQEVDPSYLIELGYEKDNSEDYSDQIISWMAENVNINLEGTVFYLKYSSQRDPLLTVLKLTINPINPINKSYLIIEKEGIIFKENYGQTESGGAAGLNLNNLKSSKIIEFIFPEGTDAISLPLYISPPFSELPGNIIVGECDNDGECEEGEDDKNCLNDCHKWPWGRIIMWIIIILFCALVVYIILQEWYKHSYEGYLFKNKNDLYNLMSFMDNALRKGVGKEEVYNMLKKYKWNGEQISYAFKKLFGQRTGMWEIPIFRAFENKKIQRELEARRRGFDNSQLQKI
jgi:PKD repeat protein